MECTWRGEYIEMQINEKETTFTHAGLQCWTRVGFRHKNGYVAVDKAHPLFGVGYHQADIAVHGGLTYAGQEEDLWVFGFDTAHAGDYWVESDLPVNTDPRLQDLLAAHRLFDANSPCGLQWTNAKLISEIESLATQLAGLA